MRRREFIGVLASAASWRVVARAQQAEIARRIGILLAAPENDPQTEAFMSAFRSSLEGLGWAEKRNLRIESRVTNDAQTLRDYALELAKLDLDVIVTYPTPSTAAIKETTSRTPIVFVYVADPVGSGFVDSLARPG